MSTTSYSFRRRDLVKIGIAVPLGYAAAKAGIAVVLGPQNHRATTRKPKLKYLSAHDAAVVSAASLAIIGDIGNLPLSRGVWQPARQADHLLGQLTAKERQLAAVGFKLFEYGATDFAGVSRWPLEKQRTRLADWRESNLELQRSVWALLHAIASTSFGSCRAGWTWMNYGGPCRSDGGYPGRTPGQSVAFDWDPSVP